MEDKLNLKEGPIWMFQDVKNVFQELYDHYRAIYNRNEYLAKENERLKSEAYKDEELSTMKEKYNKMYNDFYRGFPISEEEDKKIHEWMDKIIGDGPDMKINSARFYFEFHPTPLGVAGWVVDGITKQKFQFSELD